MERVLISELMEQQDDLYHHGVLGMKWGVRRYQPYSLVPRKSGKGGKETGAAKKGSTTGAAKKSSTAKKKHQNANKLKASIKKIGDLRKPIKDDEAGQWGKKKSRKQKQEEVKTQRISDEKTARERKLKAAEVVKSGNAKLIYENRADLTDKQLQDAINRIGTEARLRDLVAYQNPTKMQKLARTVDKVKPLIDTAETGINAYNQVARVANAFMGENETGRKNALPYIGKAQNSYNRDGEISSNNRNLITNATKISDLMNAAGKLNSAEAKLAVSKAESIEKLRKYADAEKEYSKAKTQVNTDNKSSDVNFDVDVKPASSSDSGKAHGIKAQKWESTENYVRPEGATRILKTKGGDYYYSDGKNLYYPSGPTTPDGYYKSNDQKTFRKSNPFYDVSPEPGEAFRERTPSERSDYLKKSLSDISKGDTSYKKSEQEKADQKRFDDYFEAEVKKAQERKKKKN